mmetsp:Transcript_54147/g.58723  ORF Transcript_54147/g.58723 Transcript_54147/m.58723 type:complete len:713 (-) Transcript_54147:231-2369(-)
MLFKPAAVAAVLALTAMMTMTMTMREAAAFAVPSSERSSAAIQPLFSSSHSQKMVATDIDIDTDEEVDHLNKGGFPDDFDQQTADLDFLSYQLEKLKKAEMREPQFYEKKSVTSELDQDDEFMMSALGFSDEEPDDVEVEDDSLVLSKIINLVKTLRENRKNLYDEDGYETKMKYDTYGTYPEQPDVDLSGLMKMVKDRDWFGHYFPNRRKIQRVLARLFRFQGGYLTRKGFVRRASREKAFLAPFTRLSNTVPKPRRLIKEWENDREFARQYITGVNPVEIEVAKDLSQLTPSLVSHFGNENLQKLIDEKCLLFTKYDKLMPWAAKSPDEQHPYANPKSKHKEYGPRIVYTSAVLLKLSESRDDINVMGIQLDRSDDGKVYTSDDRKYEWLYAKIATASADSHLHEWHNHLAKTHLAMEPHIIAVHNTLRRHDHPLATFFKPLFTDTLILNWGARKTLATFLGDELSSLGSANYMKMNLEWWKTYDFFKNSGLPSELEMRGFDEDFDMPCYLYREDGMRLWDVYGEFASDFVDEIFDSDKAVYEDPIVREWVEETTDESRAAIPGFPTVVRDKATLVKIMQTIMWTTSGQHAAVNFPQYDHYGFVPNKPLNIKPTNGIPSTRKEFYDAMPSKEEMKGMMSTTDLLTLQSEDTIDELTDNFKEVGKDAYKKMGAKLEVISNDIEKRNKKRKKNKQAVYSYLHPANVPAAIDI